MPKPGKKGKKKGVKKHKASKNRTAKPSAESQEAGEEENGRPSINALSGGITLRRYSMFNYYNLYTEFVY